MRLPRNAQIWLPDYLAGAWRWRRRPSPGAGRLWVMIADHYDPLWADAPAELARRRVEQWRQQWPLIASRHHGTNGRPPCYTFFYPQEEYRPHLIAPLVEMKQDGIADVEVHIHHDERIDPAAGKGTFTERMQSFLEVLSVQYGLLRKENGLLRFGFIHGNWALDNSLPDSKGCGLNNELTLLSRMGCYADFTMPSGDSPSQASLLNSIYWATDDPDKPRSHAWGVPVQPGVENPGDLLMIPGPLGLRWRGRVTPRLETGELAGYDRPTAYRVKRWLALAPSLGGDVFLKLFTHGAQERNLNTLLGGDLDALFTLLKAECASRNWQLRYASAWDMFRAVRAQQQGIPLD